MVAAESRVVSCRVVVAESTVQYSIFYSRVVIAESTVYLVLHVYRCTVVW